MKRKNVWFIRHCQGEHNIDDDFSIPDPRLTDLGLSEAGSIAENSLFGGMFTGKDQIQLILTSPLTRCLQTCMAAFQEELQIRPTEGKKTIKVLPVAFLQESYAGYRPCDTGRTASELRKQFPTSEFPFLDFSMLEERWFDLDLSIYESDEKREKAIQKRLGGFVEFLSRRQEHNIVVVAHKGILRRMMPLPRHEIFKTAEVRLFKFDFESVNVENVEELVPFQLKMAERVHKT